MSEAFISEVLARNWDKNGRNEIMKLCRGTISSPSNPSQSGKALKQVLYELCWHVMKGSIKLEQALAALGDIQGQNGLEVSSRLADVFVLLDIETQCITEYRPKFLHLLSNCSKRIIPDHIIKERLDFETTGEASILKSTKGSQTKFIKIKTRLFYKQQKFNLFREESEGFAKLMTELNQEDWGKRTASEMLEIIQSLIGCFNLDPNRVLDIILESFENNLERADLFVALLKSFLSSSATISQVLGFKFTFYQNDGLNETPDSLYKVAALLLQNRLISLDQIYNILTPEDSKITESYKHELAEARLYSRKSTMLAISSTTLESLPSGSSSGGGSSSISAEKQSEIKASTTIKEIEKPWVDENQKLGLVAALLEVGDWEEARKLMERLPEFFATSQLHISQKLCQLVHYVIDPLYQKFSGLPGPLKPTQSAPFNASYAQTLVKQINTFAELQQVFPMVYALGPHLHTDPILMVKIIRLSKAFLCQKNTSRSLGNCEKGVLEYDILSVLDEAILPSLSLLECNCCMAEEIWSLVRLFPYQHRYRLYKEWKNEAHLTHPLLIRTKADTLKKIKYIMKRLSKENVKPSGRQIGKLSHSNPGFLFDYILSQLQTFDNMIGPVVDSLKYLTSLSYDVLAYCVIEVLSNSEKERFTHDGVSISMWIQSLATFCGAVFRKYPIDLTGLLQFVANQLKAEKCLDLLILKEVIQKMSGIESSEMTNDQLEAMAGGALLKVEGGYFSQHRNTKKSSQRLKEALLDQDLAIPLCLLISQQKSCIIFKEQQHGHLKLIGKLFDQCQDTLVQYGSFLASNLSTEDYADRLPPIGVLLSEYHLQPDVAFFLTRPLFSHSVMSKYEELRKMEKSSKNNSANTKTLKYCEAVETVVAPIISAVCPLNPPRICEDLSPSFFVMFWLLSMYDLCVPTSSYERVVGKLQMQMKQIDENKDLVQSKKKKEKERCQALIDKLQDEERRQQDHCGRVLALLKTQKDNWFQPRSGKNETITQFLQLCIFPRCIFTNIDATYCAKFVHLIHTLKTPNFSTLICYDRILCDISFTVTCCTEYEANRYGKFLCTMLETVMRWHSDKKIFDQECTNFPGFMTKFKGSSQSQDCPNDHVDYENYRHVCHKWHFRITKALVICLESGDYIQIRNTLIVLTKVIPYFPLITNLGLALERRVEKIRTEEKDKRADIYALATGYLGQLKAKKPHLVPEQDFHVKEMIKIPPVVLKQEPNTESSSEKIVEVKIEPPPKQATRSSQSNRNTSFSNKSTSEASWESSKSKEDGKVVIKQEVTSSDEAIGSSSKKSGHRHHHNVMHGGEGDSQSDSGSNNPPHSSRRPVEAGEIEKAHKRRRVDVLPTKDQESKNQDRGSAERNVDRSSSSRERNKEKTPGRESSTEERGGSANSTPVANPTTPEKLKTKEKRASRKKEHNTENGGSESAKRLKKEEAAKALLKKEMSEAIKDAKERHRRTPDEASHGMRVGVSEKSHGERVRERRSDKDEKKHHRASSNSNSLGVIKKRS